MSKVKDKDLLYSFNKYKTYEDEEFRFLIFPYVNKYKYVISNYGKVYSFVNEKRKKCHEDKDGYLLTSITIEKDGEKLHRNYFIHRLVAYTFCQLIDKCYIVNHIDGNKKNNYYKNLEWTTPLENTRHALRTGLQCNSGVNCPSAIYSEETVRLICEMFEDGFDDFSIYKKLTGEDKINDMKIYSLIHSIKKKKRHRDISSEYNIPDEVISVKKQKFTKTEIELIDKMILEGKRSIEIARFFGENSVRTKYGQRIADKVRHERKRLQIKE